LTIVNCVPSYWLVQVSDTALGGSAWPPLEAWIVIVAWTLVLAGIATIVDRRNTVRV
jgi:hypothetical protein